MLTLLKGFYWKIVACWVCCERVSDIVEQTENASELPLPLTFPPTSLTTPALAPTPPLTVFALLVKRVEGVVHVHMKGVFPTQNSLWRLVWCLLFLLLLQLKSIQCLLHTLTVLLWNCQCHKQASIKIRSKYINIICKVFVIKMSGSFGLGKKSPILN